MVIFNSLNKNVSLINGVTNIYMYLKNKHVINVLSLLKFNKNNTLNIKKLYNIFITLKNVYK